MFINNEKENSSVSPSAIYKLSKLKQFVLSSCVIVFLGKIEMTLASESWY